MKPPMLDRDIRSARARARPLGMAAVAANSVDPRALLLISFCGPLSVDPEGLLQEIVRTIAARTPTTLSEAAPCSVLRPGQWAPVRSGDSMWLGSFRVQLATHAEAQSMAVMVRTFAVQVGDVLGVFDVHSPYHQEFQTAPTMTSPSGFRSSAAARGPT